MRGGNGPSQRELVFFIEEIRMRLQAAKPTLKYVLIPGYRLIDEPLVRGKQRRRDNLLAEVKELSMIPLRMACYPFFDFSFKLIDVKHSHHRRLEKSVF